MTEYVHVEPGYAQRPAFASWGLSQDPPLQTASASGWDVPVELYPSVPPELLEGAYVDGYAVQGAVAREEAPAPPEQPAKPVVEALTGGPRTQEARRRRKSAAVKPKTDPATIVKAPESRDSTTENMLTLGMLGGAE